VYEDVAAGREMFSKFYGPGTKWAAKHVTWSKRFYLLNSHEAVRFSFNLGCGQRPREKGWGVGRLH
jgi:hypothetical protein